MKRKKILLYRTILILFLLGSGWLGWSAWAVYAYSEQDETQVADAAIVLGAGTYRNRPSPVLQARIDHAVLLYERGLVSYLIFTGGQGQRRWQGIESEVAKTYALSQGVPESAILIERQSTSTLENLCYAQTVATDAGLSKFLIVSTPYHMKRALYFADAIGLDAYSSPTESTRWISRATQLRNYLREVVAYAVYRIQLNPGRCADIINE